MSTCTTAVVPKHQSIVLFALIKVAQVLSPIKGVPQPIPDPENPFHFKLVNETPNTDENGRPRAQDDFQPRANIKKLVSKGALSSQEEVEQFLRNFAVERNLVQAYTAHLEDLKIQSNIRARERVGQKNKRTQKTVDEYA